MVLCNPLTSQVMLIACAATSATFPIGLIHTGDGEMYWLLISDAIAIIATLSVTSAALLFSLSCSLFRFLNITTAMEFW